MSEGSNLKEDLNVLKDMYPEVEFFFDIGSIDQHTVLWGKLPFDMFLSGDHLLVQYEGFEDLYLLKLPDNVLSFLINPEFYPSVEHGLKIAINSSWMSKNDKNCIIKAISKEFSELTNPISGKWCFQIHISQKYQNMSKQRRI